MQTLELTLDKHVYRPKETIIGIIRWQSSRPLKQVEVTLLWSTRGKGTQDFGIVEQYQIQTPDSQGHQNFTFELPDQPYSFSGKLISLIWAVEAACSRGHTVTREKIRVSPTGREYILRSVT